MANELRWLAVVGLAIVAGLFLSPPTSTLLLGTKTVGDSDRDRVPDSVEQTLCGRTVTLQTIKSNPVTLGGCDRSNWIAPSRIVVAYLPTGIVPGPDADRDGIPASVLVTRVEIDINPFRTKVALLSPAADSKVPIDPDDHNAEVPPTTSHGASMQVPYAVHMGSDADFDGLPSSVSLQLGNIVVDRRANYPVTFRPTTTVERTVDPDDADPDQPAASRIELWLPVRAFHTVDSDQDYMPGSITVHGLTLTIDRRTNTDQRITQRETDRTIVFDADDKDRTQAFAYSTSDADIDAFPDEIETVICLVQDPSTSEDGVCIRSDGTGADGSGVNYVQPMGRKSPWAVWV